MKIWTVANQKGGVGKTTTTVSLGGLLADRGLRTLLVDMDPQGSLTGYFKYDPDTLEQGVYRLFQAVARQQPALPEQALYGTGIANLELMPATFAMATLDRVAGQIGRLGLVLKNALGRLRERVDYVLIDCPPLFGVLMVNALAACERVIIPVQAEFLALKGLERMLHTLGMILAQRREPLPVTIVPTLFDRRTRAALESLEALRKAYPSQLWRGVIPMDTRVREASRAGLPPGYLDPTTQAVLAYTELLQDLLRQGASPPPRGLAT